MKDGPRVWIKTLSWLAGTFIMAWAGKETLPASIQALGLTLLGFVAWLDETWSDHRTAVNNSVVDSKEPPADPAVVKG